MAKSYEIVWNDMLDQKEIKFALTEIHKSFSLNDFVDLGRIEKIIIYSATKVDVVTDRDVKHYFYDDRFRKSMAVSHSSDMPKLKER